MRKSVWFQQVHLTKDEVLLLISGMCLCVIGAVCNIIVKAANGGKMPVFAFPDEFAAGQSVKHVSAFVVSTKLNFLSDWINIGSTQIWSIGDVLSFLGVFIWLIAGIVIAIKKYREAREICKRFGKNENI
jgi:Family of unknown function (DUF5317)